jgi:TonB family protein
LKLLVLVLLIGSVAVVCVAIGVKYWPEPSTAVGSKVIVQPAPTLNEGKEGGASKARDDEVRTHHGNVRKKYVGARANEYRFAVYLDNWLKEIERVGNLNYPEEARRNRIHGSLQLTVGIRADGEVESVVINRSSKSEVLDQAAIRIVRLAAPFERLPEDIKADTDILYITRTWTFRQGEQFNAR